MEVVGGWDSKVDGRGGGAQKGVIDAKETKAVYTFTLRTYYLTLKVCQGSSGLSLEEWIGILPYIENNISLYKFQKLCCELWKGLEVVNIPSIVQLC